MKHATNYTVRPEDKPIFDFYCAAASIVRRAFSYRLGDPIYDAAYAAIPAARRRPCTR